MTVLIKDSAQELRAAKPTTFGMNPFIAERFQSFGLDPRDHTESVRRAYELDGQLPRRRMPAVSSRPVLNELSIDYRDVTTREILQQVAMEAYETEFIQEEVAPTALVSAMQGTINLEDATEERRIVNDDATALGKLVELQSAVLQVNYTLAGHGLEDYQTRADLARAPGMLSVSRLVEKTSRKAKRQHEFRVMTALQTAANYAAANRRALGGGANWNGGATANPIADMQFCAAAMMAPWTHAVMSLETWQRAQINAQLRSVLASQLGNQGTLRVSDFGTYFGIPRVVVDEQRVTRIGATAQTRLYVAGTMSLLHVSADPQRRTFARTYALRQGAAGWVTLAWYDEAVGSQGADRVKVSRDDGITVVDNTYGTIITGI